MKKTFIILAVVLLALSGCASSAGVQRVDSGTQTDLSGRWNDTDVRIVCEALISDCLNSPRVEQALRTFGRRTPTVIVGRFKNESSEHINTAIISSNMEMAIFNSGKMDFVAGGDTREDLRAEKIDQMYNASESSAASIGNEKGADFMLTGSVRIITDKAGNQETRTYFVSAELTSIETNQRIWVNQNSDIKKVVTRAKVKG
jgi:uncharacterized protein (TIGR02722 family)